MPKPGRWTVELPSNAPDVLDLAVYSKNPKVRLGVTGWRRPRRVGDTVRLKVVVHAPFAVVDLAKATVRVSPPSGSNSTSLNLEPQPDGVYLAEFKVSQPGAYEVDVKVRNDGKAAFAGDPSAKAVPEFERARRVQIHVADPGRR
jgi:ferric-dicitrate binding protein FerR (iron transport regulator)